MFRRILQNILFLAWRGLALRGDTDGEDSKFLWLLHLQTLDCPAVADWMEKKQNKSTSGDIQNEVLQIMAPNILRGISSSIRESSWFTITAEGIDVPKKEQFWVDSDLFDHEDIAWIDEIFIADSMQLNRRRNTTMLWLYL